MGRLDETWLSLACPGAVNGRYAVGVSGNCMDSNRSPLRIKDGSDLAIKRITIDELLHSGKYINKVVAITIEGVQCPVVKEFVGCRLFAPHVTPLTAIEVFKCGQLTTHEYAFFKYYNPTETTLRIDASKILLAFEVERILN